MRYAEAPMQSLRGMRYLLHSHASLHGQGASHTSMPYIQLKCSMGMTDNTPAPRCSGMQQCSSASLATWMPQGSTISLAAGVPQGSTFPLETKKQRCRTASLTTVKPYAGTALGMRLSRTASGMPQGGTASGMPQGGTASGMPQSMSAPYGARMRCSISTPLIQGMQYSVPTSSSTGIPHTTSALIRNATATSVQGCHSLLSSGMPQSKCAPYGARIWNSISSPFGLGMPANRPEKETLPALLLRIPFPPSAVHLATQYTSCMERPASPSETHSASAPCTAGMGYRTVRPHHKDAAHLTLAPYQTAMAHSSWGSHHTCRSLSTDRFRSQMPKMDVVERAAAAAHEALASDSLDKHIDASKVIPLLNPQKTSQVEGIESFDKHTHASEVIPLLIPQKTSQFEGIGALRWIPSVPSSEDHLASAVKRSIRPGSYKPNKKNVAAIERSRAARQLDNLMKELSVPLTKYIKAFPDISRLHLFDQTLLRLTVGEDEYHSVLRKVAGLRNTVQEVGKGWASRATKAPNKQAAFTAAADGVEAIIQAYTEGAHHVDKLKEVAKKLRSLPRVELTNETLVLVGAPNVGKSSLVRVLSSGSPEVQNYPFTTRSIHVGHFFVDGKKHQITDTPGLLARTDEERNVMEQLTLATLDCLPSTVLFVMDLTEDGGQRISNSHATLGRSYRGTNAARTNAATFRVSPPNAPPIGVSPPNAPPNGVSLRTNGSIILGAAMVVTPAVTPADIVSELPYATRISTLTNEGVLSLQRRILNMFTCSEDARIPPVLETDT
eukprot:gene11822-33943_t